MWFRVAEAERSGTDVLPYKLVYNVSCSVAPVRQFIRGRRLQSAAACSETEDERSPAYMARSADDPDPPIEDGPGRTRSGRHCGFSDTENVCRIVCTVGTEKTALFGQS